MHSWVSDSGKRFHRAVALPGYGLSDKPLNVTYNYDFYADILDGFLDALDIADTHLCVHHLACPVVAESRSTGRSHFTGAAPSVCTRRPPIRA
jgi:hypothetical protein